MYKHFIIALVCGLFLASSASAQESSLPTPELNKEQREQVNIDGNYKNKHPYIESDRFKISTGSLNGVYYPVGEAICRVVNRDRNTHGQQCKVEASPGSIYNIRALKDAEVQVAIVQSDWQEHAVRGTSIFSDDREGTVEKLRHIMSLYTEAINVVVVKNSSIYTLDDLKSKVVNFGVKGSGSRATIEELVKVKGWDLGVFSSIAEYRDSDQPEALCSGQIDAMIVAAGTPNKHIHEAASKCEIRMIEVTGDEITSFVSNNPRYSLTVIPGGIYNGVPKDIRTYGFKATLVTTTDTSEKTVYNITKSIFDNLPQFKTLNPSLFQLDKNKMVSEGRSADYHSGAKKYYIEAGLIKG